jgi:tetratricopeptide (TPR) repeat protein
MDSENDFLSQGVERLQAGEYKKALILLDQAIVQNPQQPDAWYQKGLVLQKLGRYVEAVKANQKFSALTRALKRSDKKSKKLKPSQSVKTSKNSDVALEWFEQGTQELRSGNFEGALTNYDKGLEIQPENSEGWYARGIVLHYLNDYGEAIASFDQARAINPNDHNVWNMRGVSLSHFNRCEEAISSFDQALKITPDDYQSWFNRGITLCDYLARYEEAITSFDEALKIKPDYCEAWYNRGVSLSHLSRYEEAIASETDQNFV